MEVNDSLFLFCYVLIKGGFFYLLTNGLFFTAALVYDYKNVPSNLQSTPKLFWTLIYANMTVFLLWNVPPQMPAMRRYFTSGVASENLCLSMFLSMFSHQGFVHLFFNMYVLKWVATIAIDLLGPAQFMAMYLSGGVFSVLFSLCYRAFTAPAIWSLGASGANCALIGYFCVMLSPEQLMLHIVFLPMFPFSPKAFLYGNLAFETVCLLRIFPLHRFVLMDHAAHIGGLLFGMCYAHYGEPRYQHLVNWMRGNVGALPTTTCQTPPV